MTYLSFVSSETAAPAEPAPEAAPAAAPTAETEAPKEEKVRYILFNVLKFVLILS